MDKDLMHSAYEELAAEAADLRRLHDLISDLCVCRDLSSAYAQALRGVAAALGAQGGVLVLPDFESGALKLAASLGIKFDAIEMPTLKLNDGNPLSAAIVQRQAVFVEDMGAVLAFGKFAQSLLESGYRAFHVEPLFTNTGSVLGAAGVFFVGDGRPTERGLRLMRLFQLPAVRMIESAGLHEQAQAELAARKRAEESLRKFSHAVEQSASTVVITNTDGTIEYVNPKFAALTGYSREEALGQNPRILKSGKTPPEEYKELWRAISAGHEWRGEFQNRKKNGELYWEYASISPVTDDQGVITHFVAVKEDITARKEAEAALREANNTLATVIRTSPLAICTLDLDGNVRSWNPAAERIFGWAEKDVLGRRLPTVPESNWGEVLESLAAVQRGEVVAGAERRRLRKDGSSIDISLWVAGLRDASERISGVIEVFADITERKQLEAHLRRAQKMEAVGRLAGGIAHDFNNLLTIIGGYSELLLKEVDEPQRGSLEAISEASRRAEALTRQLLTFSRHQVIQPSLVDLNRIIAKMGKTLTSCLGEDVTVITSFDPDLWRVKVDPGQIEQVILNLIVNARDAMPTGGKLTIETTNLSKVKTRAGQSAGDFVRLKITDTGTGMDDTVKSHLFEPFFTTKPRGQGSGLGLSTVYGIVIKSGGEVEVESDYGRGTSFSILFPRAQDEPGKPPILASKTAARPKQTILLVEDEAAVRKLIREMLSQQGFTVLEAGGGQEALRIWDEQPGIDLLLTDVVMPQMSGRDLANRLKTRRPDLKVVYMSGYTDDVMARHGILESGLVFLQKPFSSRVLASRLREVLGIANE